MYGTSGLVVAMASLLLQSFERKLRSYDTIVPASCAALTASAATCRVLSESALKMPPGVQPADAVFLEQFFQFTSPGFMPLVAVWPRS
jgi:hypothetical protein